MISSAVCCPTTAALTSQLDSRVRAAFRNEESGFLRQLPGQGGAAGR